MPGTPAIPAAALAKMKDVTIKTGPKGGLGNIAIQTNPYDEIRSATLKDVYTADESLRGFLKDDTVGHDQRIYRNRSLPATDASVGEALVGDNTHITTFNRSWANNQEVVSVTNGASPADLKKVLDGSSRQLDATLEYRVHGADSSKWVQHKFTLFHNSYDSRVVAAVDHFGGAADASIWDRLSQAIKDNGGKVLKNIIRV